jgi:cobalt-zinc-cadmium efflux system membrane fusion protein
MKRFGLIIVSLLFLAGFGAAGLLIWNSFKPAKESAAAGTTGPRDHVTLSSEKFAAAQIEVTLPSRRELQSRRIVPGRVEYDATRHVEVKSPFDGLIRRIDVKVGDRVTEGKIMAFVDSPELGDGRADVLLRETDLEQAINEHGWWHSIQANLDELLARLKRPVEIQQLEKEFADKPLGDYRQQILTAYSRMRLAEKLSSNVKPAGETGGVSVRVMLELGTARDTTTAEYAAACEQATFDVKQKHLKAESAMKNAENRLIVAKQRLSLLVNQPYDTIQNPGKAETLSTWPVKAPFTATVEEILLAPKERVQTAQGLFQLADASRLWVQAQIRERDWSALTISAGQTVQVQTPALPGETLEATVAFVGRVVSIDTRAVPLTAEIDNKNGKLRPGMIVRVLIPDGPVRECLALPQTAVTSNDGRTFVFVETGEREYHLRDVKTGFSVDPWIEILSGIEPGERVVTSGTALLKAEMLLEPEE